MITVNGRRVHRGARSSLRLEVAALWPTAAAEAAKKKEAQVAAKKKS